MYLIVDDPQQTAQTLNDDLVKLHTWKLKKTNKQNKQNKQIAPMKRSEKVLHKTASMHLLYIL